MESSGLCRVKSRVLSWKAGYTKQDFQGSEQGSHGKQGTEKGFKGSKQGALERLKEVSKGVPVRVRMKPDSRNYKSYDAVIGEDHYTLSRKSHEPQSR